MSANKTKSSSKKIKDNKTKNVARILVMLLNNERVFKKSLAGELNVSKRTVNRYVKEIRGMDIPLIEEDSPQGPQLYLRRGNRDKVVLSMDVFEAVSLNISLEILRVFEGEFLSANLSRLRLKLADVLREVDLKEENLVHDNWINRRFLPLSFLPFKYDMSNSEDGIFNAVIKSLWDEVGLSFKYSTPGKREKRRTVYPYTLVFYKGAFYLMCSHVQKKRYLGALTIPQTPRQRRVFIYALSKMTDVEVHQEIECKLPSDYSPEKHFSKISGMLPGNETEVVAKFSLELFDYLNAKEWSPGTTIIEEPDYLLFKTKIRANEELAKWFIGFGDKTEVIEPPAFREMIIDMIKQSMSVYDI